ncbi:MAG TPA: transketolase [Erysipelotrichaceae bacterium]|jgi:transketolase|nr:transketolase [Erysipelotrichaceae bacterium]
MLSNQELSVIAKRIRRNVIKMVTEAKSGHIGGAFSATEIAVSLYFNEMNITKDNLTDLNRDKFVLSKGHASALLFAVLCEKGFLPEEELLTFRKINSRLQGHPNMNYVQGVDMSTGSLGQGLSTAVGMALSYKIHKQDFRVYSVVGDGESEEGQIWEAAMAAAHFKLDNLCAVLDMNGLQIDGDVTVVMNPFPLDEKFAAFGWHVIKVDGHDYDQLQSAYAEARTVKGKPTMIIARTVKGKGVSFMENDYMWHGVAPTPEQAEAALKELED